MKKNDVQFKQAQAVPEHGPSRGDARASPQGERIAQFRAWADGSTQSVLQRRQAESIQHSRYMAAQRRAIDQMGRTSGESVAQLLTDEKLVKTKNHGTAHYQFDYDDKGNIDDFSNNRATTAPVGADPVDGSSHVDLETVAGSGEGEMLSGREIGIIGASRPQHFSMADNLNDTGPADRKGAYTWHHLTPKYQMVLVDMGVHAAFGHAGGFSIWK